MAEKEKQPAKAAADKSAKIVRDPNFAKNRVFIGNLPTCTKEEMESICKPYGNVIGSLVQKNFGFVQFESEEIANKTAAALNRSTFKGNLITVRNAGANKQRQQKAQPSGSGEYAGYKDFGGPHMDKSMLIPGGSLNTNPDYNDCEIIVVDRRNTKYAEMIEDRLKMINLRVDVLFPNEDVPLGKVLSNISSRGCLYAVLVTNQHQELRSITVNILYGQPAEHRNMPVDDAINLIAEDFRNKLARENVNANLAQLTNNFPKAVPISSAAPIALGSSMAGRHPDAVQTLLNLLADNRSLTVLQYDRMIKYLQDKREQQIKIELGDMAAAPDPEIELQKKILSILNKPSVAETQHDLLYNSLDDVKQDYRLIELLKDVRVQKAMDSLLSSNLLTSVQNYMKF